MKRVTCLISLESTVKKDVMCCDELCDVCDMLCCSSSVSKHLKIPLLFKSSPLCLTLCAILPDKQYLFFKNFAFHSSVHAAENATVKEILISVLIYYLYKEFLLA